MLASNTLRVARRTTHSSHLLRRPIRSIIPCQPILRINSSRHLIRAATTSLTTSNEPPTTSSKLQDVAYSILGAFAITILGGISYMHQNVGGTQGLQRTLSFYSLAIPKYILYRYHMICDSDQSTWDDLDQETSQEGLDKILELGGFYIKSGQMAASNIGNAFPKIWQDTMAVLQNECPSKGMAVVKTIIEEEFDGMDFNDIFESFEETPIGAASIGQVHRATLKDGQRVVVKVMYPEVEELFRGDVRTIKMFAQIAQPVHVPPLDEIEKQFMTGE